MASLLNVVEAFPGTFTGSDFLRWRHIVDDVFSVNSKQAIQEGEQRSARKGHKDLEERIEEPCPHKSEMLHMAGG